MSHDEGDAAVSGEVRALLAQWDLEKHATVFAELAVDKVRDLKWVLDSDVAALPVVSKRKAQAMLHWWRGENAAEPAHKKATQEPYTQEEGAASPFSSTGGKATEVKQEGEGCTEEGAWQKTGDGTGRHDGGEEGRGGSERVREGRHLQHGGAEAR
ncbi:hypothetical protein T484DRAFT_1917809, partial [Baffinella frigidus]